MALTRTAVFTALAGDYEKLRPHPDVDTRWIAFTDGSPEDAKAQGWEHRPLKFQASSPRRQAKWYKVNASLALPSADRTLWVDASVALIDAGWIERQLKDTRGLALFQHPERQCIYTEALASMDMPKYRNEPLLHQIARYRDEGHPTNWGLWAGGVISRARNDFTASLETAWWHEIDRWSTQDQLSLPYVLRRRNTRPGEIPGNLYSNPHFRVHFQPQAG